jgi:hypothetical protein
MWSGVKAEPRRGDASSSLSLNRKFFAALLGTLPVDPRPFAVGPNKNALQGVWHLKRHVRNEAAFHCYRSTGEERCKMPSVMNIYVGDPSEELQHLWDKYEVAWRDYVIEARKLRTQASLKALSNLDHASEQRAWDRVSDVRARINEIMHCTWR